MFDKALIIAALNPFHEGHKYLFSKAQEFSRRTDIYIGRRNRPRRLPRDIRVRVANENIKYNGWENSIQIINAKRHLDLDGSKYDLFITGSDLLNAIHSSNTEISKRFKAYYFSFPNILSISRDEMPLSPTVRTELIQHVNLMEIKGFSMIAGKKIRQAYRDGRNIEEMVSRETWEIIRDYIHVFKD